MRLVDAYQFAGIDRFTSEFRDHATQGGKAYNWGDAMEEIYERIRPVPDRPITQAYRKQSVARLRETPLGQNVNMPLIRFHLDG
jgi:hypothetical protein